MKKFSLIDEKPSGAVAFPLQAAAAAEEEDDSWSSNSFLEQVIIMIMIIFSLSLSIYRKAEIK